MVDLSVPYCGPVPSPGSLLRQWNLDPTLLIGLCLFTLLLTCKGSFENDNPGTAKVERGNDIAATRNRPASFIAVTAAIIAFVSPLCAGTVALLSFRSVHHLLVALILAPAISHVFRSTSPARLPGPLVSGIAFAIIMLLWHYPPAYSAAWNSHLIYWLMQLSLLALATLWWHHIFAALNRPETLVGAILNLTSLSAVMGFIGAVLTFAPSPLFLEHLGGAVRFGIDPLADQQLAGLVMWVPGALPLILMALHGVFRSLPERHAA